MFPWLDDAMAVIDKEGPLEEGNCDAVVLNDAIVCVCLENGDLKVNVVLGEPKRLDVSINFEG